MQSSEMSLMSGPIKFQFFSLLGKAIRELCFAENPIKIGLNDHWGVCPALKVHFVMCEGVVVSRGVCRINFWEVRKKVGVRGLPHHF